MIFRQPRSDARQPVRTRVSLVYALREDASFAIWAYYVPQRPRQVARSGMYALLPGPRCSARYVDGSSRTYRHTPDARDMRVTDMPRSVPRGRR